MPLGLTLIEAQKYARRAEQLAVLKTFAEGELLRRLPFRNLVGGSLSFPAETKLPRVGFRAVNEGYRQSYGVINSDSEFVHLFGGDLDVDRSIVDLQGPEARAAQTEMKVRSMRLTLEAAIINGDDTFDPRAFNGLSKRLLPGEDQTIDNGGSTLNLLALEAVTDSAIGYGGDFYEVIDGRHYFGITLLRQLLSNRCEHPHADDWIEQGGPLGQADGRHSGPCGDRHQLQGPGGDGRQPACQCGQGRRLPGAGR